MSNAYAEWIEAYRARHPSLLGMCAKATLEMVEAFPELKRVPGHVFPLGWGMRAHWWCKTPDGEIVDPTASQFPGFFPYEEWAPGTEIRVGKCMNCGESIYNTPDSLDKPFEGVYSTQFCDKTCYQAMADEVGW